MTDRLPVVIVNGQLEQVQAGDQLQYGSYAPQVFEQTTPPTIAYPALNFTPVAGYTGLFLQQVNA